jgi:hypothetical protein
MVLESVDRNGFWLVCIRCARLGQLVSIWISKGSGGGEGQEKYLQKTRAGIETERVQRA